MPSPRFELGIFPSRCQHTERLRLKRTEMLSVLAAAQVRCQHAEHLPSLSTAANHSSSSSNNNNNNNNNNENPNGYRGSINMSNNSGSSSGSSSGNIPTGISNTGISNTGISSTGISNDGICIGSSSIDDRKSRPLAFRVRHHPAPILPAREHWHWTATIQLKDTYLPG
ncbi:hypothetical protein CEP54_008033 [Fusarium duplospermum]|uniref:Uncharacterized protein n=1 Tax=Fusarium duplospermum TaxID=1325734 RepID=A0A428PYF5_9HYPO|nr:hypothetical protein CEP54_008033 [Fusarium duplospermum]